MSTHLVHPGREFRGIRLGESSSEQVYETFGRDCETLKSNVRNDEVLRVSYLFDEAGNYDAARDANRDRPDQIVFESGYVIRMGFGVYQKECFLPGTIRSGTTRDEVVQQFGDEYRLVEGDKIDKLVYLSRGLELWIQKASGKLNSFYIFRPVGAPAVREAPVAGGVEAAAAAVAAAELEELRGRLAEGERRLVEAERRAAEAETRAAGAEARVREVETRAEAAETRAADAERRASVAESSLAEISRRPVTAERPKGRRMLAVFLVLSIALLAVGVYTLKA